MKNNRSLTPEQRRKKSVRSKMHGTSKKPRVSVFRSNKHIYVQAIDDDSGKVLASANDVKLAKAKSKKTKTQRAAEVAKELSSSLTKKKVKEVIFDRGSYKYHGRVKMVAETLRENGIKV